MKKSIIIALLALAAGLSPAMGARDVAISDLELEGEIDGENIVFTLDFEADVAARKSTIDLVVGDVAYLEGDLPRGAELTRRGSGYVLIFARSGRQSVSFKFASRAAKEGDWRRTLFAIPVSSVRHLSVICDRDDLEIRFPGALRVTRGQTDTKKTRVTAYLGTTGTFEVQWKPEVKKLESELVVTSDANTIATASVGALRIDTVYTYRVIQGVLSQLVLDLPDVNVTQVRGADIREWKIDRSDKQNPKLVVQLGRPKEDVYRLQVESEMILPEFPCDFKLPVLAPRGVLRASGFLMIGTDSAIKLQVSKAGGLTQVDQGAFPAVTLEEGKGKAAARPRPSRSPYAYQYANSPYAFSLTADDIVTSFTADNRLVLRLEDNELALDASIQIEVKDAPAREIVIETDPDTDWTVTSISGAHVSEADTDVREENGMRVIYVPFKKAVTGTALVDIRMETSLAADAASFSTPRLRVRDAKTERGYLVAAAEQGIRLKATKVDGMQEVFTGSAPMRVEGAQQAFRFKDSAWSLVMGIERTLPSIHSEVFHLVSLGEGVMYCSAAATYHIGGAPIQEFTLRVPVEIEALEFTGADIEGWTRKDDLCKVRLQTKIMGDYTLLVTYDAQYDYRGADILLGGIETVGTESEVGYIAVASSASLKLSEAQSLPPSIIEIDRDEIPTAYSSPVTDPIIRSYKYVRRPHAAVLRMEPFDTEHLLGQIADYVKLSTAITKDGEAVTTALYYIKNASRQYLVAQLPAGAKLWTVRYVDENGRKEDVLSQESKEGVLIPVRRPRDPNTALSVEVRYAESLGKLGFWRSGLRGMRISAVRLPDTHATFANWSVEVPEDYTIAGVGGHLTRKNVPPVGGLSSVVRKALGTIVAALDGPRGRSVAGVLMSGWGGPSSDEFTRTVNLAEEVPLDLRVYVVPYWVGNAGSARMLAVWLLVGVLGVVFAAWKRRSVALAALALTVIGFAAAQCAIGSSIIAVFAALAIVFVLIRWPGLALVRLAWRLAKRLLHWAKAAVVGGARLAWRGLCIVGGGCAAGWRAFRASRERAAVRKLELRMAVQKDYGPPPFVPEGEPGGAPDEGGFASVRLLGIVALACLAGSLALASGAKPAPPALPVMDSVKVSIDGPGTGSDVEQSARVKARIEFTADDAISFVVLPVPAVLTDADLGSRYLKLSADKAGYTLHVARKGEYRIDLEYQVPVTEQNGSWVMALDMLPNMRNRVKLALPEGGLDIRCDAAVMFKTDEAKDKTLAEAVFGPGNKFSFSWRPRARKTTLEDAVFFCEANTHALLLPGLVELTSLVRYQVAQGEIRELKLSVPAGTSVTAVRAHGLATWSYDPEKRLLVAILEKAVSGDFQLVVVSQVSCEGLPYTANLGAPHVLDASRQRGSLALAAPDTVQVRVDDTKGLNPMNIEDFSAEAVAASGKAGKARMPTTIRRAFRYHRAEEVAVTVHTEQVLPELRVEETSSLSIADERIVLSSKINVHVAKSGIFSIDLQIPAEFDVETLTGKDVSHWDESGGDVRTVKVHFSRRVTDATELNVVVAKTGKGIDERIGVPRVVVADARKHWGKLTVSGERGVRLMVESHRGVDIKKASEEGIRQKGVLVFDILRPTWAITLKTEVLEPLVKPEVLQWVDLAEGMLQCRSYFRYRIENAGIKTFMLQSPVPGVTLSVTGRNIARVHEVDAEKGLWQVDLHSKVESLFAMTAAYQVPYAPEDRRVKILPLRAVETEGQRGYLVVTCAGRVQVEPAGGLEGLKVEDPRSIPVAFGAGDLSSAILCYRTVRDDYELDLSVVRHASASVLPASVDQVRMTSVVSRSRRILTRVEMQMTVGNLRFLRLDLQDKSSSLWTVLVNGKEVAVSRDEGLFCIPLEEQEADQKTTVDMVCAGAAQGGRLSREQQFEAPRFVDLPLDDIEWTMFVPPGMRYYGFDGTMEYRDDLAEPTERPFSITRYSEWNKKQREATIQKAKDVLNVGQQLVQTGQRKSAKKAFQQALNYSQGQADLNEDARVQLRNLVKQQFKIGLVNRRDALRVRRNIQEESEQQVDNITGFQEGDYTQEYADSVEGRLTDKDNSALEIVADKIIDQQAAAAGVVTAIRVTMPEHGRRLTFTRALQIDPKGDLTVIFKASDGWLMGTWRALWPSAILFVLIWIGLGRVTGRRETVSG